MKEILQSVGMILAVVIAIIGYISAICRYIASKKDEVSYANLFENLTGSSAIAMIVLVFFVAISMFF